MRWTNVTKMIAKNFFTKPQTSAKPRESKTPSRS
ncbi:hypothetical protein QC762_510134 [Podospora pseudocomata]|uniref:Uncharacterized protein n=1 Tax=Podospora pseudocomata TaxID=2093779 RepID=A0ABR0GDH3_9PEZI|nr:hypothetical protein QC762_510134 [Podospora pseudocomata]